MPSRSEPMHTSTPSWLDLPPAQRLGFVLLAASLAWLGLYLLTFGSIALTNVVLGNGEGWPHSGSIRVEVGGWLAWIAGMASGIVGLALWGGKRGTQWIACALGGAVLAWLIQQANVTQATQIQQGAGPLSYQIGLDLLLEHHRNLTDYAGLPGYAAYQLSMAGWGLALIPWAWAEARGWRTTALLLAAYLPLLVLGLIPLFVFRSHLSSEFFRALLPRLLGPLGSTLALFLVGRWAKRLVGRSESLEVPVFELPPEPNGTQARAEGDLR